VVVTYICRAYVLPLLCSFLYLTYCGSSHMYWDLLLACRVVELSIDIFVLWLWVAPFGCSGNLVYALCPDGSFRVMLTFLSGADYCWVGSIQ
jgi:hypothetical protein